MNLLEWFKDAIRFVKICKNWYNVFPYYFRDTLFIRKKPFQSKKILVFCRNNLKYFVRSKAHDLGILTQILYSNDYRLPKRKLNIIIDIGAQIGGFTCYAALNAKMVISYEPDHENFNLLKKNIKINGLNNVKAFQMGVSNVIGKRDFYVSKNGTANHSLVPFNNAIIKTINTTTLERIIKHNNLQRISFLKIDCEGCEFEILKSSISILNQIEMIAIDSHHGYTKKITSLLKKNGFIIKCKGDLIYGKKVGFL